MAKIIYMYQIIAVIWVE